MAYQHGIFGPVFQHFKIEFHPDNKHKEDKADLAQELKVSKTLNREQRGGKGRQKGSGKGRAKQYSGYNFAYHCRLPDFERKPAQDTGSYNYSDYLCQQKSQRALDIMPQAEKKLSQ